MGRFNECEQLDKKKVLGLIWNSYPDTLQFEVKTFDNISELPERTRVFKGHGSEVWTKRLALAHVNQIYDPLGFISPFTIKANILLRKLWTVEPKLEWNDPLPGHLLIEWRMFCEGISSLGDIKIKRVVKPRGSIGDPVLVMFSDASKDAYGAVAYAQWEIGEGKFESHMLMSKTRVAPIKTINIVRLELAGAVLSKRIRVFIEKEMRYPFKAKYHLTDSEIVKGMISKESYGFNTYVANRIGEIQENTSPTDWFVIAGKLNIADWLTRGKEITELDEHSDWHKGPSFMKDPFKEWPVTQKCNMTDLPERIKVVSVLVAKTQVKDSLAKRIDIDRFSKLERLVNTTARILKLYVRFKKDDKEFKGDISVVDKDNALDFWVYESQKELHEDVKSGRFKRLVPRYQEGKICVGGRGERWLKNTWNRQLFTLLPYSCRLSLLILRYEHEKGGHAGVSATVSRVRSKFRIIRIHRLAPRIVRECIVCRKWRSKQTGQIMSSLPIERLQPSPPFFTVGVDYFGPFVIRGEVQKRMRGKCFGVIFTCFAYGAVYIDLSRDYSTDSFLQVLRLFASIRGWPHKIHSDRGTQLVRASKELKGAIKGIDKESVKTLGRKQGMLWEFTPAEAPWMNGVTESLVKSVRVALSHAIGEQVLEFSTLQTVLFEAAELVNSRSIGRHPTDPDEGVYLSPNDLLLGRSTSRAPRGPLLEISGCAIQSYFVISG